MFALCIPICSKVRGEGREIMPKMNPEIKEKWLTALRSGDYAQGKGWLCKVEEDGSKAYCCLGVLTDLYLKETGQKWEFSAGCFEFQGHSGSLPSPVRQWSGVKEGFGGFETKGGDIDCLSGINDQNDSFDEVIEIIEERF